MISSRLRSKERSQVSDVVVESEFIQTQPQLMYIDYELKPDDTLHTVSINFSVSMVDLKRINGLLSERDIYALKYLKIPIKENSINHEKYVSQLKYAHSLTQLRANDSDPSFSIDRKPIQDVDSQEDDEKSSVDTAPVYDNFTNNVQTNSLRQHHEDDLVRYEDDFIIYGDSQSPNGQENVALLLSSEQTEIQRPVKSKQSKEAKKYLKKMDNKLESLINHNQEIISAVRNNHRTDMEQLVPISNISYSVETRAPKHLSFFSLNVRDTLFLALLIVVVCPILFLIYRYFYMAEHNQT